MKRILNAQVLISHIFHVSRYESVKYTDDKWKLPLDNLFVAKNTCKLLDSFFLMVAVIDIILINDIAETVHYTFTATPTGFSMQKVLLFDYCSGVDTTKLTRAH